MEPENVSSAVDQTPVGGFAQHLRLYVARSTPNSVRAERNLSVALAGLQEGIFTPMLEIIDVFSQAKRAIDDGVVVTPTLICCAKGKRCILMGDLADHALLQQTLGTWAEMLAAPRWPDAKASAG
jgi:hypothetical protein